VNLRMTLSLPSDASTVTCSRTVIGILLSVAGTTAECRNELSVIMTEACTNAVVHSTPGSDVDISVIVEDRQCILEISNRGDTVGVKIRQPDDPLCSGGRGLPLMATLADTVAFLPAAPGHVRLRVTKLLPDADADPDTDAASPDR
jgi:serine/threonine-protein kinase RsbW